MLQRIAMEELRRSQKVRKVSRKELEEELRRIIVRFAEKQHQDAALIATRIMNTGFPTERIPQEQLERIIEQRVADIVGTTVETVRRNIFEAEMQARDFDEDPDDTKRRIRQRIIDGGSMSFERAETIARTELALAENSGLVAGYKATGATHLEWFSFPDAWKWKRRHDTLDGKIMPIGAMFETHLGNRLRFPHDPNAPVGETINCRCTVGPVGLRERNRRATRR
ncbi:MAG: hypothetical protein GTO22_14355 [Gemmatimonadales bacterium]|nr:hypothetical protein [Gemmatimonadales bacterium]